MSDPQWVAVARPARLHRAAFAAWAHAPTGCALLLLDVPDFGFEWHVLDPVSRAVRFVAPADGPHDQPGEWVLTSAASILPKLVRRRPWEG